MFAWPVIDRGVLAVKTSNLWEVVDNITLQWDL